jgi:hypothetical protein
MKRLRLLTPIAALVLVLFAVGCSGDTQNTTVKETSAKDAPTTANNQTAKYGLPDIEALGFTDYEETTLYYGDGSTAQGWEGGIVPPGEEHDTNSLTQFVEVYMFDDLINDAIRQELTSSFNSYTQKPMQTLFIGNLMFYCQSESVCKHIKENLK